MSNNITNRVTMNGATAKELEEIKLFLKSDNGDFDFNKIIHMPEILRDTEFSEGVFIAAENAIGLPLPDNEIINFMRKDIRITACFSQIEKEYLPDVIKCIQAYYETGFTNWYRWSCENWKTKWNAYSIKDWNNNSIEFDTAWSGVTDLILKLSQKFKGITIEYIYADEDTAYNVGNMTIKNGVICADRSPENNSSKAYELYFELNPDDREYYELIDGKYKHIEED